MTIWILAVIIFVVVGALGRQVGGIRMGISCIGVAVALLGTGPLCKLVIPLFPSVGLKHPIIAWSLAAPLVFLGIMMFFNSIAVAVYLKIGNYYKYRAPDDVRMKWEAIDKQTGLAAGVLAAVFYLIAASSYIYLAGQISVQLESPKENPFWMTMLNKARKDLQTTGFDRVAAGASSAAPSFFKAADVLGLLYHNPELRVRVQEYPLFLPLAEQPDVSGAFTNEPFSTMLNSQTNVAVLLKEPIARTLLMHPEINKTLQDLDTADFLEFLKTGQSARYSKEPVVGKWVVDVVNTVRAAAKANPKATPPDLGRLRAVIGARMFDLTFIAAPNAQVFLKASQGNIPPFSAILSIRTPLLPQQLAVDTNLPPKIIMQGTWKKDGDKYSISFQSDSGERTVDTTISDGGRLTFTVNNNTVVFERTE